MISELWGLLVLATAGLVNVELQIGLYWILRGRGRLLTSQVAGAVAGLALLLIPGLPGPLGLWAANLLIYGAFCYVYFHWNNTGETARRIRLVWELDAAPDGLTEAELLARYPAREILERRLVRLIDGGQIVEREGQLALSGRLILLSARLVALAKRIVLGRRSELDGFDHLTLL